LRSSPITAATSSSSPSPVTILLRGGAEGR
jgi:hypothetical protein